MATDSKQLYLIAHDHRTKKRKDFDVLPPNFTAFQEYYRFLL